MNGTDTSSAIQRFDPSHLPEREAARQIAVLYKDNCRGYDQEGEVGCQAMVRVRDDADKVCALLQTGRIIYAIVDERQRFCGLLECREEIRDDVMVAFIVWLLVDQSQRGKGYSSLLHRRFEEDRVQELQRSSTMQVCQALGVHMKNPALDIYRKWGYVDAPFQYDDGRMLFLIKDPDFQKATINGVSVPEN